MHHWPRNSNNCPLCPCLLPPAFSSTHIPTSNYLWGWFRNLEGLSWRDFPGGLWYLNTKSPQRAVTHAWIRPLYSRNSWSLRLLHHWVPWLHCKLTHNNRIQHNHSFVPMGKRRSKSMTCLSDCSRENMCHAVRSVYIVGLRFKLQTLVVLGDSVFFIYLNETRQCWHVIRPWWIIYMVIAKYGC